MKSLLLQTSINALLLAWFCTHTVSGQNHLRRPVVKSIIAPPKPHNTTTTSDGRIIYFQHIHKSGGSTMCRIAALNQMTTSLKTNCNVQEDQRCCGGNDSMAALQKFAATTKYTFVANEGDMYEAMDTEKFRYVIVLRNSLSRYISHYKHAYRTFKHVFRDSFSKWWKTQPDNFIVRKICGTRCQEIHKYQISPELFQYTLERLSKYEDFLFIERFKESLAQFSDRVGWSKKPSYVQNQDGQSDSFYPEIDTKTWDPLMSNLDDALYDYAEQRFAGIENPSFSAEQEKKLRYYFTEGPKQACETPCCSPACSLY